MSSGSSFVAPLSRKNDRQKPEVAAPGTLLRSTSTTFSSTNGWFTTFLAPNETITGTSFAAPMVTGGAALLIQRNGVLAFWPEALRSILMATAVHNVDGLDSRLSDKDGAGGIALDLADDVVTRTAGRFGRRRYDCAAPNPLDVTTFWLNAGLRTRVAIAWNTDPTFSDTRYKNRPSADLDLQILGPGGSVAARSVSFDNTYEIVELYPAATGQHTLRVRRKDCLASPRRLGWVVSGELTSSLRRRPASRRPSYLPQASRASQPSSAWPWAVNQIQVTPVGRVDHAPDEADEARGPLPPPWSKPW